MLDDMLPGFSLPAIGGKKVTAAFDGGRLSSDGGVLLLAAADQRLGLTETLAGLIPDPRDPVRVTHTVAEMVRARVFAIGCGYPDADDLDTLRRDPAFKLACGRLPESGADLASQPTLSRLENAPDLRALLRRPMRWLICGAKAMRVRRARSRWTSMTRSMWCTGTSRPRCSTRTMVSAAFCRSMSMKLRAATAWQPSCAPARPRTGGKCVAICAA